jgi:Sec7-like guanine-nucleotide exchange factor
MAGNSNPSSLRAQHEKQKALESVFTTSLTLFTESGVRKGLAPLLSAGYVEQSAAGISHFLRLCGHEVAPDAEVGDYLGDNGRSAADIALHRAVRLDFLSGLDLASVPFDVGLRMLLTRAGFRLPGESQKVERIAEVRSHETLMDLRGIPRRTKSYYHSSAVLTKIVCPCLLCRPSGTSSMKLIGRQRA